VSHVGIIIVSVLFAVVPVAVSIQWGQRAKALNKDLKTGERMRFSGVISETMGEHPLVAKLIKISSLSADRTEKQSIDILASGRVWRVNDRPEKKWLLAMVSETATVPEVAHIAAQWLDPLPVNDNPSFSGGNRELSVTEKQELRNYARQQWRPPLLPGIGLTAWSGGICVLCITQWRLPPDFIGFFFLLILTVLYDIALLIRISTARCIAKDIAAGNVLIVQGDIDGYVKGESQNSAIQEQTVEFLPQSNMTWTVDGEPASWRKSTGLLMSNRRKR